MYLAIDRKAHILTNLAFAAFFAAVAVIMYAGLTIFAPVEVPRLAHEQRVAIWETWSGPREIGADLAVQNLTDEMFRIDAEAQDALAAL